MINSSCWLIKAAHVIGHVCQALGSPPLHVLLCWYIGIEEVSIRIEGRYCLIQECNYTLKLKPFSLEKDG